MFRGILTAADNFAGRSTTSFGIGEIVNLSFVDPQNRTADAIGGLRWVQLAGGGTLAAFNNNGVGSFTAPSTPGPVRLQLQAQSGAHRSTGPTLNLTIVAPSDAVLTREPRTPLYHELNTCTAGFAGLVHFLPRDVSFANLQFMEETIAARASGFFAGYDGRMHPRGDWHAIGSGNLQTGCRLTVPDSVRMAPDDSRGITLGPPYGAGNFEWAIPWMYRVGSSGPATRLCIAVQHATADANGVCSISKKGCGPFSRSPSDPSTDYYALAPGGRWLSALA